MTKRVCGLCVARNGLKASDLDSLPDIDNHEAMVKHLEEVHGIAVKREGESAEQALARLGRDTFVSASCVGEKCFCGQPAQHKVEETIFDDDPHPIRHPFTSYICHDHFVVIMGPAADA